LEVILVTLVLSLQKMLACELTLIYFTKHGIILVYYLVE